MKTKRTSAGFTIIILLIASVLVVLLSIYAYSKTMKRVQKSIEEEVPGSDIPAPTLQNYQQTLDGVKQNLNENMRKERQKLDDAQKEME